MRIILEDSHIRESLLPITATRHTSAIRIGILTIKEKWEKLTGSEVVTNIPAEEGDIIIPANIIPSADNFKNIIDNIKQLKPLPDVPMINYPWDISIQNHKAIIDDFPLVTKGRSSSLSGSNNLVSPGNIFAEEGAIVNFAMINASGAPVYIGKNVHIMEGSMLRGPIAICEGSVLKMGSKIYSGTTIGPWCVVGGEVKNSVILGYSNKAHDGYLGDSVIGEWCNLGAGTSNSNVKNTGGDVKYLVGDNSILAGNKAGLIMGDYSRSAINTSFNTGTIVGVCCNIFAGVPPKATPDFTWGNDRYIFEKALRDIQNWKAFKNKIISEEETIILKQLYHK